jgi:hypothetical protein
LVRRHRAVACERRKNVFVPEVLRKRFVFFWTPADLLTEPSQSFPKSVWIAVREAGRFKRVAEYPPNGRRVAPPFAIYTNGGKLTV